jgi:hypothetical protein
MWSSTGWRRPPRRSSAPGPDPARARDRGGAAPRRRSPGRRDPSARRRTPVLSWRHLRTSGVPTMRSRAPLGRREPGETAARPGPGPADPPYMYGDGCGHPAAPAGPAPTVQGSSPNRARPRHGSGSGAEPRARPGPGPANQRPAPRARGRPAHGRPGSPAPRSIASGAGARRRPRPPGRRVTTGGRPPPVPPKHGRVPRSGRERSRPERGKTAGTRGKPRETAGNRWKTSPAPPRVRPPFPPREVPETGTRLFRRWIEPGAAHGIGPVLAASARGQRERSSRQGVSAARGPEDPA